MKIFNFDINIKKTGIVLLALAFSSGLQLFILTMYRKHGDTDFFELEDTLGFFFFAIMSLISTLIAWEFVSRFTEKLSVKTSSTFFIAIIIFMAIQISWDWVVFDQSSQYKFHLRLLNAFSIAVVIHIQTSAFTLAYLHLSTSQKTQNNLELVEKEKAILQSQILHKNLEPHFLFNNLSVLSGLARKQPNEVESFIDDFSDVYRYYLKHSKKQLIGLEEELLFLKNYMSLTEKRFGNAYQLHVKIENVKGFIIPCSLQLCVENAIKHNKASDNNPLIIYITYKNNCVIVKNKINKVDFTIGTGTGNDYIKRQYEINYNKDVVFTEINNEFIVKIPLIPEI